MANLRDHCNEEQLLAHRILDGVKAGIDTPSQTIAWALCVLGDTIGIESTEDIMKPLHINEARCAGRDTKPSPTICPQRDTCQRHTQMEVDRQLGISGQKEIKVMSLPRVGSLDCHYRIKVA